MSEPIFINWNAEQAAKWGKEVLAAKHRLNLHPLFSLDAIAELINRYPREHYTLVQTGPQGSPHRTWREGDIGGTKGRAVLEAIQYGRMWLNLRDIGKIDQRYRQLLDQTFEEVRGNVPGSETLERNAGMVISSPNAQVYYHADIPGRSLWQLHGRKRVFIYPAKPPFLTDEQLETVALYEDDVEMHYDTAYDNHADVFEIAGGDMLHWPVNAPHCVENIDGLNVSMTAEYWTRDIRRRQTMTVANAILRQKVGLTPKSRATRGLGYMAKAALQAGVERSGYICKERQARRTIEFILDPRTPGATVEIREAAE